MKNAVQDGIALTLTAPYALATSGLMFKVGSIIAVAQSAALNGATVVGVVEGVFDAVKLTTDVVTLGQVLYWDDTNKRLTTTASTHAKAGYATEAASGSATTVKIRLVPTI